MHCTLRCDTGQQLTQLQSHLCDLGVGHPQRQVERKRGCSDGNLSTVWHKLRNFLLEVRTRRQLELGRRLEVDLFPGRGERRLLNLTVLFDQHPVRCNRNDGTYMSCLSMSISIRRSTVQSLLMVIARDCTPHTGQSSRFSCSKVYEYTPSVPMSMK